MWENDAFLIRKGMAHTNPNAFTYISWSNMIKKYIDMQSEAATLRRLNTLENNMNLIQSLRSQKKAESSEAHKQECAACKKGQSGETIWCASCKIGYTDKSKIDCKDCFDKGTTCEACIKKADVK